MHACIHREHILLLNRKRVNKGMKRTNSLPLSPVVLTRPYYRENRYLQVLRKAHMGWDFDIHSDPRVGNLTRPPS